MFFTDKKLLTIPGGRTPPCNARSKTGTKYNLSLTSSRALRLMRFILRDHPLFACFFQRANMGGRMGFKYRLCKLDIKNNAYSLNCDFV